MKLLREPPCKFCGFLPLRTFCCIHSSLVATKSGSKHIFILILDFFNDLSNPSLAAMMKCFTALSTLPYSSSTHARFCLRKDALQLQPLLLMQFPFLILLDTFPLPIQNRNCQCANASPNAAALVQYSKAALQSPSSRLSIPI